jgi:hypothetical protein
MPVSCWWSAGIALFWSLIGGILITAVAGLIVEGIVAAGRALLATGKSFGFLVEKRESIENC